MSVCYLVLINTVDINTEIKKGQSTKLTGL